MKEFKEPQPQNQHPHKHSFWKRFIIVIIGLTIFAIGTFLWILSSGRIISGDWSYILPPIFTFFGLTLSLLAWLFPNAFHPKRNSTSGSIFSAQSS